MEAEPAVWEDPYIDWSAAKLCVIRSTWDYAYRLRPFLEWVKLASSETVLWNPPGAVHWNTHKSYLVDLPIHADVPTTPTVLLEHGRPVRLAELIAEHGWSDVVIKAAVAQSGRYAMRVQPHEMDAGQAHLDRLLPNEDMIVQPFLTSIAERGEVSLVFIDGEFSHAVRKRAVPGEFRVHSDWGGSERLDEPTDEELHTAQLAMRAVFDPLLYGRVDLVQGNDGAPVVMELEVVEPELFFELSPDGTRALTNAIIDRL